jgi:hypothetical protein
LRAGLDGANRVETVEENSLYAQELRMQEPGGRRHTATGSESCRLAPSSKCQLSALLPQSFLRKTTVHTSQVFIAHQFAGIALLGWSQSYWQKVSVFVVRLSLISKAASLSAGVNIIRIDN